VPTGTVKRESAGLELRDYLRILRHRRWTVALTVAVVVGANLGLGFIQVPVYAAQSEVVLQTDQLALFDTNTGAPADIASVVDTEIEVIRSEPVKNEVERKVKGAPKITAHQVGDTQAIVIVARSTKPELAAATANAYATAYIDHRRTQAVEEVSAATTQLSKKITELQTQAAAVTAGLPAQEAGKSPTDRASIEQAARNQQTALSNQEIAFQQRLDQLQVEQSLKTGGAQLVSSAHKPTTPASPRPVRDGAIAGLAGLIIGIALAFVLEHLDDSIKTADDASRALGDVPVVGTVPVVANWKDRDRPMAISISDPTSPPAEAYRTLRTALQFMALDRTIRTIQVTSSSTSEGKTTTVANLGTALARAGQSVIIVCCDLRRPRIHNFFGLSNEVGFTSALVGMPLHEALQDVPEVPRLRVLASGPPPPNPAEVLSSRAAHELLAALQGQCDVVLIDCPPVLPVTDATILATLVDATIVVVTPGTTNRSALHRGGQLLRQVDASIVGIVLNGVGTGPAYGYGYGYGYGLDETYARNGHSKDESRRSRRFPAAPR
jgi:non-specific protein-tyrosine kinase